jgi:hypothetical protein
MNNILEELTKGDGEGAEMDRKGKEKERTRTYAGNRRS